MSLMAANEESDPSAILNGFWVTLFLFILNPPDSVKQVLTTIHRPLNYRANEDKTTLAWVLSSAAEFGRSHTCNLKN